MPSRDPVKRLAQQRAYRDKNRERLRKYMRGWKSKHRETVLKGQRDYYQRIKPKQAAYYRAKYKRERPQILEKSRAYYYANPEKFRARYRKYMARKLGAAVGSDRASVAAFYKMVKAARSIRCYWCGRPVAKSDRHIDHIIPLVKGGADDIHNLCCSCSNCNLSKATKRPEDFTGQFELPFVA